MKSNVLASSPCAALLPLDNPPFARAASMKEWRAKKPFPALCWVLCAGLLISALGCGDAGAEIATIKVLHAFAGTDGANPVAGLTLSNDGATLYGTAQLGGSSEDGTVFSVPASGGVLTTLWPFPGGASGEYPIGGLTLSSDGSTLYGTTTGLPDSDGTVFAESTSGGAPIWVVTFSGANGEFPGAELTLSPDGTTLYGTTQLGGSSGDGTVFSVPTSGLADPTALWSFTGGSDGTTPVGGLTLSHDGSTLYGTTSGGGGSSPNGTVFSMPASGGTLTTLVSFTGGSGANPGLHPEAGVTLSADGSTLYGTTADGGSSGNGTVFAVPASGGGSLTWSVSFTGSGDSGVTPDAGLTLSSDGSTLYGTTGAGGSSGNGTVFAVPASGLAAPITLASFDGVNATDPEAGLTFSSDGKTLYGTSQYTSSGGGGNGTVFEVATNVLVFTTQPASTTAGSTLSSIAVQLQDAYGNPLANSGTNITLTLNGGTITSGTLSQLTDGTGKATFGGLVIDTAASGLTFTATSSPLTGTNSTSFDITAGAASQLAYTVVPATGTAGTPFSVTVQSQDAEGNPSSPTSDTTITLSVASGGGALSGTLTGTILASGNSVTISTPVYSKSDTMTLTASATAGETGLTPVTSGSIVFSA
ncbi:MAG: choice-of-anchor tandem repeat GloVer-containing protein, partial [Verrucomicrobiota bacterium]